jgi:hypothetical protein
MRYFSARHPAEHTSASLREAMNFFPHITQTCSDLQRVRRVVVIKIVPSGPLWISSAPVADVRSSSVGSRVAYDHQVLAIRLGGEGAQLEASSPSRNIDLQSVTLS